MLNWKVGGYGLNWYIEVVFNRICLYLIIYYVLKFQ
jgi:hypothetical protein